MHAVQQCYILLIDAVKFCMERRYVDQSCANQDIKEEASHDKGKFKQSICKWNFLHEEEVGHNHRPNQVHQRMDYNLRPMLSVPEHEP